MPSNRIDLVGFNPFNSLRARVGVAFITLTLLLSLVLAYAAGSLSRIEIEQEIGQELHALALDMVSDLDATVYERWRSLEIVSDVATFTDPGNRTTAEMRLLLDRLQANYVGDYAWIGFVGLDGQVIVATGGLLEGEDVSTRNWFINGRTRVFIGDVHEAVQLADLLDAGDERLRFVDIALPVRSANGEVIGVLAAHLDWRWAARAVRNSIHSLRWEDTVTYSILDVRGNPILGDSVLTAAGLEMVMTQKTGTFVDEPTPQSDYLIGFATSTGYKDYRGLGWTVVLRQDAAVAFASADQLQMQIILAGFLISLFFAFLSWLIFTTLTRPLAQITESADRIRAGDLTARLPRLEGKDEIARLAQSLDALIRDLTEQFKARTLSEASLAVFFRDAHDIIMVVDSVEGKILTVNPAVNTILGYDPHKLMGDSFSSLFPPDGETDSRLFVEQLHTYGYVIEAQTFLHADGRIIPLDLNATMIPWNSNDAILVTLRDVSEREAAQRALQRSQILEVELEKAQELNQLKDEFISFLSHEARTPLAVIMSSASMLTQYFEKMAQERRIEHLDRIINQTRYMTALMDDLLIISRARMGKLEFKPEPMDLGIFLRERLDEIAAAAGTNYRLIMDMEWHIETIQADPKLLRHILINLLNNAVKYSPDGGEVRLSLRRESEVTEAGPRSVAVIRVSDQGIGIPEKDQKRLFEPFHRASNTQGITGTGLGLSIVRASVVQHGGRIKVESAEGKGTTFTVVLPIAGV